MNVFKSKEVYKHVIIDGVHKLIPVRGVYVATEYRPPYLIDNMLMITGISNTPAVISEYTKTSASSTDIPITQFGINISTDVADVTYYTKATGQMYPGPDLISQYGINISTNAADITMYSKSSGSTTDPVITTMSVSITDDDADITSISLDEFPATDSMLKLVDITSNRAIII